MMYMSNLKILVTKILVMLTALIHSGCLNESHNKIPQNAAELAEAVRSNNLKAIKKVVPSVFSVDTVDPLLAMDWQLIHIASAFDHAGMLQYLIDNGSDIAALDSSGLTPLHCAAMYNAISSTKLLLKMNTDVNAVSYDKYTSLHCAVDANNYEIVELLIEAGAITTLKNHAGLTVMDYAIANSDSKLIDLLESTAIKPSN